MPAGSRGDGAAGAGCAPLAPRHGAAAAAAGGDPRAALLRRWAPGAGGGDRTGPDRTGGGGGDGSVGLGERVAGRCRPLGFSTGDRGAPAPPRLRLGVRVCEAGRRLGAGLRLRQPLSRAGVADRPLPARGRVASGA